MSSQWAKLPVIAWYDSASAAARLSSVASENTTPKPKVSFSRLRSRTTTSFCGSAFFIRMPK